MHLTESFKLGSEDVVQLTLVAPATMLPLQSHWNEGFVPLFTGIAVNVAFDPEQREEAVIETEGVTFGKTVVPIALEVTVDEQTVFEVNEHVIESPVASELVE